MNSSTNSLQPRARILVIDDNAHGLNARKVVLEEMGHTAATSPDPKGAMTLLSKEKFDIVITDYRMPGMNGAEIIRWMREQGIETPVILISGFVDTLGLTVENTGAEILIQKSAHEVNHMMRAVRGILKRPARKPAGSQIPPKPRGRKASS
jgi:CheY-like chemotaxis protein